MDKNASKRSLYQKLREDSFVESHLIIQPPAPWYKMSGGQLFRHNIGPGIWNDIARNFISRAGIAVNMAMAAAQSDKTDPITALSNVYMRTGAQMIGQRIGIATFGAMGAKIGTVAGEKVGIMAAGRTIGTTIGSGIGIVGFTIAADALASGVEKMSSRGQRLMVPDLGYGYRDTQGAATMRQRSLMAMKTSRFNTRSVLGNEAYRLATGF